MSKKSIFLSILAILTFAGVLLGIIYLFKFNFLMVFIGIVALLLPAFLQRKALYEASGTVDKVIAKYIVPALAVIITFLAIMALAVWIK